MTLHRHWPEVEKMLVMVDSFATPRALWHTDPEFRRRMLAEWDKIEPYKAKGFIAEWPVTVRALGRSIRSSSKSSSLALSIPASVRSARIELFDAGRGQRQPYRIRRMAGAHRKGRRGRQRDVAAGRGGDESLRAPVRRQRQPQMVGFGIGLDLEAGKPLGCHLLAPLRVDPLQPDAVRRRCRRPSCRCAAANANPDAVHPPERTEAMMLSRKRGGATMKPNARPGATFFDRLSSTTQLSGRQRRQRRLRRRESRRRRLR